MSKEAYDGIAASNIIIVSQSEPRLSLTKANHGDHSSFARASAIDFAAIFDRRTNAMQYRREWAEKGRWRKEKANGFRRTWLILANPCQSLLILPSRCAALPLHLPRLGIVHMLGCKRKSQLSILSPGIHYRCILIQSHETDSTQRNALIIVLAFSYYILPFSLIYFSKREGKWKSVMTSD